MKRIAAGVGIVAGLGLLGYALFAGQTDEEQIRERLVRLGDVVGVREGENLLFRKARLNEQFEDLLDESIMVSVSELGKPTRGRSAVATYATGAGVSYPRLSVQVEPQEVTVQGDSASARAEVTATAARDDLDRTQREVDFVLRKNSGDWQVLEIRVSPPE